jgi:serine/threonine protein kinase
LSVPARDLIDALLKKNPRERIQLRDIMNHPFMKRGCMQELIQQVQFFHGKDKAEVHIPRLIELFLPSLLRSS